MEPLNRRRFLQAAGAGAHLADACRSPAGAAAEDPRQGGRRTQSSSCSGCRAGQSPSRRSILTRARHRRRQQAIETAVRNIQLGAGLPATARNGLDQPDSIMTQGSDHERGVYAMKTRSSPTRFVHPSIGAFAAELLWPARHSPPREAFCPGNGPQAAGTWAISLTRFVSTTPRDRSPTQVPFCRRAAMTPACATSTLSNGRSRGDDANWSKRLCIAKRSPAHAR